MYFISVATILVAYLRFAYAATFIIEDSTEIELDKENYRLPTTIMPVNYNLTFKPYLNESDPKAFTFDGEAFIEIMANQLSNEILMHTKNLNYTVREYWSKDNPTEKFALNANAEPNNLTDIITYSLTSPLVVNQSYILHFVYTGHMANDDLWGFYRSYYKDTKNNTKWIGSTQFEPNFARRAFPSFDEPKFKATFKVSLVRHNSMKTYSNTRIKKSINQGVYITDIYATTPRMSSYTLAFMICDYSERYSGDFGVAAPPYYYAQTEYSFDLGQTILSQLNNYFGLSYNEMGIDKLHITLSPQSNTGGMENWGLITLKEHLLLYDEGNTTLWSKLQVAASITHELAHMWFGNLVTFDWYSYAWLNEGFATYFGFFTMDQIEPDFELEKQFLVKAQHNVMFEDSLKFSHPLSDEDTNTPDDLMHMLAALTYHKGAAFIRMVKHVMGEEYFQASLKEYLLNHKYENTKPSDLFKIWKKYWPLNSLNYTDSLFSSFTTQIGYPVVTFNLTSSTTLEISQKHFLMFNNGVSDNLTYTVPLTYTTNIAKDFHTTKPKLFISNSTSTPTTITLPSDTTWIIGNIQQTGYYRVNYDNSTWHNIKRALFEPNWGGIPAINRAQILDDLFNLVRAEYIDIKLVLEIMEYMETEINYLPWTVAIKYYKVFFDRFNSTYVAPYILQMTQKAFNFLGFEEKSTDTTLDILNRYQILTWSCKFGNSECISKAKEYFRKDLKLNAVPVEIRDVVYCTAMRYGNLQDFEKLFNMYKSEIRATEKDLIFKTLSCAKDSTLVANYFDIIMSDEIPLQDKSTALSLLYKENKDNFLLVLDLIGKNFDQVANVLGNYSDVVKEVNAMQYHFLTPDHLENLKSFIEAHRDKIGTELSPLEEYVYDALNYIDPISDAFVKYLDKRKIKNKM